MLQIQSDLKQPSRPCVSEIIHRAAVDQLPLKLDKLPPAWALSAGFVRSADDYTIVLSPGGTAEDSAADDAKAVEGIAALGVPIVSNGQRAITITAPPSIVDGDGDVFVGLCDAREMFTDTKAGRAWGVRLKTGEVHTTMNAYYGGESGRLLYADGYPHGGRRGPIVGALVVIIIVDMDKGTLAIQLGERPPVDTYVDLRGVKAVRPWALCVGRRSHARTKPDWLRLGTVPYRALRPPVSPAPPGTVVQPPPSPSAKLALGMPTLLAHPSSARSRPRSARSPRPTAHPRRAIGTRSLSAGRASLPKDSAMGLEPRRSVGGSVELWGMGPEAKRQAATMALGVTALGAHLRHPRKLTPHPPLPIASQPHVSKSAFASVASARPYAKPPSMSPARFAHLAAAQTASAVQRRLQPYNDEVQRATGGYAGTTGTTAGVLGARCPSPPAPHIASSASAGGAGVVAGGAAAPSHDHAHELSGQRSRPPSARRARARPASAEYRSPEYEVVEPAHLSVPVRPSSARRASSPESARLAELERANKELQERVESLQKSLSRARTPSPRVRPSSPATLSAEADEKEEGEDGGEGKGGSKRRVAGLEDAEAKALAAVDAAEAMAAANAAVAAAEEAWERAQEAQAAIKLQAMKRGQQARKQAAALRAAPVSGAVAAEDDDEEDSEEDADAADAADEALFAAELEAASAAVAAAMEAATAAEENAAATRLQAIKRGREARAAVAARRAEVAEENRAATKLQATKRGRDERAKLAAQKGKKRASTTLGKIDLDEGPDAPPIQLQIAAALRQNAGKVLDLFREWDANGDGEVSKKEFRKAMPAIGLDVSVLEVDALFDSWDWDGGGALNLRELSKVLKSPPPPLAAPARALPKSSSLPSLSELPANSSLPRLGQTTSRVRMRLASELDKALPMKKAAPQMNATDLREMLAATLGSLVDGFRQFDTNGDGKVDLQEFIKGVQSMVASRGVKCSPWYIEALFDDLGERSTMIYSSIPLSSFSLHVCLSLSLVPPLFPNRLSLPCPYSITP